MIAMAGRAAAVVIRKKPGHPSPSAIQPEAAPRVRSGTAASEDSSAYCVAVKARLVRPER